MFIDPKKNIAQFELTHGMKVADLGVGSGFYDVELGRTVGEKGKVFVIDINHQVLPRIKNQAKAEHIHNIEVIWGDLEKIGGSQLKEGTIDFALASNILFQIQQKDNFIKEIKRILKRNGRVAIIDWKDSFQGTGPESKDVISEATSRSMFETVGFVYDRKVTTGDYHYGMILKKL